MTKTLIAGLVGATLVLIVIGTFLALDKTTLHWYAGETTESVSSSRAQSVPTGQENDSYLAGRGLFEVNRYVGDATGDGQLETFVVAAGIGCGSCHDQTQFEQAAAAEARQCWLDTTSGKGDRHYRETTGKLGNL